MKNKNRFLEQVTLIYKKWEDEAEEYRQKHKNRNFFQRIIDRSIYRGNKEGMSRFTDINNIILSHCEDLDEVMGDFFGVGNWQSKSDEKKIHNRELRYKTSRFADALRRANYLQPLSSALQEMVARRKYEKGMEKYSQMMNDALNGINNPGNVMSPGPTGGNITAPPKLSDLTGDTPMKSLTEFPNSVGINNTNNNTSGLPKTNNTDPHSIVADFLLKAMSDPDIQGIGNDKIMQGVSVLQMLTKSREPDYQYSTLKAGDELTRFNKKTGKLEVLGTNPKPEKTDNVESYERDDKGNLKVYPQANGQKAYRIITRNPQGKIIKERFDYLSNFNTDSKDNPAPPDISKEIENLETLSNDYNYADKLDIKSGAKIKIGKRGDVPVTEYKKEVADKMKATTDMIANKINHSAPGFEDTYYGLFQNPHIKEAKKELDDARNTEKPDAKEIERLKDNLRRTIDVQIYNQLQGAPKDSIIWMKKLLHNRIF